MILFYLATIENSKMENFNNRPRKKPINIANIVSFTMAVIIIGIGLAIFLNKYLNIAFINQSAVDPLLLYFFAGMCIVYGGFRLYRSIFNQDNYHEE